MGSEMCIRDRSGSRTVPADSPALFETRTGDNHHHLVCRECGRTVDVDCVVGAGPCLTPHDAGGFAVDEAEVVFWGLCPGCRDGGVTATTTHHEEERQ